MSDGFDETLESVKKQRCLQNGKGMVLPWWEKYALTIQEASQYFGIGERTLRRLIKQNEEADYLVHIGVKILIKRRLFEKYLDEKVSVL